MQRRAPLEVGVGAGGDLVEHDHARRRPGRRRRGDARLGAGREALGERAHLAVAHAALAGAHRDRGVALEQLGRGEALGHGVAHVLHRDVLADADVAAVAAASRLLAQLGQLGALAARRPPADLARMGDRLRDGRGGEQVADGVHGHGRALAQQVLLRREAAGEAEQVALDLLGAARVAHADGLDALACRAP